MPYLLGADRRGAKPCSHDASPRSTSCEHLAPHGRHGLGGKLAGHAAAPRALSAAARSMSACDVCAQAARCGSPNDQARGRAAVGKRCCRATTWRVRDPGSKLAATTQRGPAGIGPRPGGALVPNPLHRKCGAHGRPWSLSARLRRLPRRHSHHAAPIPSTRRPHEHARIWRTPCVWERSVASKIMRAGR